MDSHPPQHQCQTIILAQKMHIKVAISELKTTPENLGVTSGNQNQETEILKTFHATGGQVAEALS